MADLDATAALSQKPSAPHPAEKPNATHSNGCAGSVGAGPEAGYGAATVDEESGFVREAMDDDAAGEAADKAMNKSETAALDADAAAMYQSILDGMINSIALEAMSDATSVICKSPVIQNEDIEGVCSTVLSELLSKVEKITAESDVLDWLSGYRTKSPRPSVKEVDEKLKYASILVNKTSFAQRLCAMEASAPLFKTLALRPYAVLCINRLLPHVPEFAAKLGQVPGVYTPMLRMAMHPKETIRDASNTVLDRLIHPDPAKPGVPDPNQISKMAAAEEVVAWMALLFEGGVSSESTQAIFRKLDDAKKVQVYLKLIEKETDPSWFSWYKFGGSQGQSLDVIVSNEIIQNGASVAIRAQMGVLAPAFPIELMEAYTLYKAKVGSKLAAAFRNNVKQPHMDSLVEAATFCGFKGTPNEVLMALAPHMKRERDRIIRDFQAPAQGEVDKQLLHNRGLLENKLKKAWGMLLRPEERIKKQFKKAMPESMLPPPVAVTAPAAPTATLMPPPSATMAITTSPPVAASPAAPPMALMPPAPPSVDDYLRNHILPRTDCDKCAVARGTDASVRLLFASEGGKGRCRNISAKRACPLAAHAISASGDGVPLLEKYESDYGVKLTNKKQKVCDFMQSAYGVERLGQAPSYKVTLYTPPRIDASLALEGGDIKLRLAAFGYEATSNQGTKDNYMGFQIV